METGKTGKYLKYAIGEIVLVVIGILIALSINNWNEKRLKKIQVDGYLRSLIVDLKSDILQYESNIEGYQSGYDNINRILLNDVYKKLEVDSISELIAGYWNLNRTSDQTYQKIKNAGLLEMLGTIEINNAVNDYYNISISHYDYLINWDKELTERDGFFWHYNDQYESNANNRFRSSSLPFKEDAAKRKDDLIRLIESTLGRNYLRNAITRDEYGLLIVRDIKSKAENIIALIEKDLSNKQ